MVAQTLGILRALGDNRSPRYQDRPPQLQQGQSPWHDPWLQPMPGHHHGHHHPCQPVHHPHPLRPTSLSSTWIILLLSLSQFPILYPLTIMVPKHPVPELSGRMLVDFYPPKPESMMRSSCHPPHLTPQSSINLLMESILVWSGNSKSAAYSNCAITQLRSCYCPLSCWLLPRDSNLSLYTVHPQMA